MSRINIAIDGPAGSGKSTAAKNISRSLGIIYLDTGAMYRAVALKAVRSGIDTKDEENLSSLVKNIDIRVEYKENEQRIFLDGEDVTCLIRTPEISMGASNVSAFPAVRLKMVELQRKIADEHDVVMDGRDIGTFVLPDAKYKFYLTASIEERARRRYEELKAKGESGITLDYVKNDIALRDKNDSSRAFAPLYKAPDALEIDTTCLNPQEVAEKILSYIDLKRTNGASK
ncbi:MAG: (d)CMP kinase [Bacillota bacterium]